MSTIKPFDPKSTNIMHWYVLCVTPGKEIKIASTLESIGIETYCPTINEIRHWTELKNTVSKPIFEALIFVKISKRNRVSVFNVPGISRYLFCVGRPAQVSNAEIETMKNWLEDETVDEIVITKYSPGNVVSINSSLLQDRQDAMKRNGKWNYKLVLKGLDVVLHVKHKEQVKLVQTSKFYSDRSLG